MIKTQSKVLAPQSLNFLVLVMVCANSSPAGVTIFSSPEPTPSLPGFTTWTVTASSDEPILALDFAGVPANDNPATGLGFFSVGNRAPMNQVNPAGLPTVFSDLNALFPAFGAHPKQDTQFLVNSSDVVVPPGSAEEGPYLLQAEWAWPASESPRLSVDFAQIVVPDFVEYSWRGVVTVQRGTFATPVDVSGQIFIEGPLIPVNADLGDRPRGSVVHHTFTVSASVGDVTWSNLVTNGPGIPAVAPMLNADGTFTWNSANSPLGTWSFDATVTDFLGSSFAHLTVDLVVPEPASVLLILVPVTQGFALGYRSAPLRGWEHRGSRQG